MAEIKYIKPRVASTEIDIALDLFERDEAMKRITSYVTGLLDDAESQFNRAMAEAKNENSGFNIPVVNYRTWSVDEIVEELKDIDAFDAAKYFFDKYGS